MSAKGFLMPAVLGLAVSTYASEAAQPMPDWHMNVTIIEACSCPLFCQCFFGTKPANHAGHAEHQHPGGDADRFCRANNAIRINKGHYGKLNLDGMKVWVSGDLGDDFGDGEVEWIHLTFDKGTTQEQKDALQAMVGALYPFKAKSFTVGEGAIDTWRYDKDGAVATIDGGKTAEVRLTRFPGHNDEPVVIKNLKYSVEGKNEGFVLMPNEVQAYRAGDKPYEYKGTNGFMITLDIGSDEMAAMPGGVAKPSR